MTIELKPDKDKYIRAIVTYTDKSGNSESVTTNEIQILGTDSRLTNSFLRVLVLIMMKNLLILQTTLQTPLVLTK